MERRRIPLCRMFSALLLTSASVGGAAGLEPPAGLAIGDEIPAVEIGLVDLEGDTRSVRDLVGENGTLIVFSSNTCPWVLDWLDRYPDLWALARESGVSFVVVNSNERKRQSTDSPEAMQALLTERDLEFPYWVDRDSLLADAFGALRTPEVFLFDAERRLVYRGALDDHSGPLENVEQHFARDALSQMLGGVTVELPLTATPGCAVQRPRRRR